VIGVESELGAKAKASFEAGERIAFPAEALSPVGTESIGECNFEHIQRYVDGFTSVSEEEIRKSVRRLAFDAHLIADQAAQCQLPLHFSTVTNSPPAVRQSPASAAETSRRRC
jgi:threonine dehydratase